MEAVLIVRQGARRGRDHFSIFSARVTWLFEQLRDPGLVLVDNVPHAINLAHEYITTPAAQSAAEVVDVQNRFSLIEVQSNVGYNKISQVIWETRLKIAGFHVAQLFSAYKKRLCRARQT
jgi:hypothetical protein